MVLTVSFVVSPETGLSCLRRQRIILRRLDASVGASGRYDFAVRDTRSRQSHAPRPPHPAPTSVTIAKRPFCRAGMVWLYCCFYRTAKRKIFRRRAGQEYL